MIRKFSLPDNKINSYNFYMQELLENQSVNMFLWIPFLMAFGAGLYFNLPIEPNLSFVIICLIFSIAFLFITKRILFRIIALFVFGFCYASVFTYVINTPQIPRNLHDIEITGTVEKIDYTDDKSRIYIKTKASEINAGNSKTAVIRVSAKPELTLPNIRDTIRAKVGLFKPSGSDAPGTFDYSRWAYFNNLSATGYINSYETIKKSSESNISKLRDHLHKTSNSFLADTLVLGYKSAVPETDNEIWTATGIGHVWSISGFHITLVSGWLFAIFYFIFRAIAPVAKRISARIPALIFAWFGLLFYLFLSGVDVATVRAFLMTTLIFAAFIFGRNAISMRNVCVAFCAIFLMNPHYVMQPGFQLSFAAIFGLVWLWNDVKPRLPNNKILKILYTATLTSIVATIFTAPFVIAHFYSLPIYGLLGNLILLPIFSVAIMPLVILGTLTSGLGWTWPLATAEIIYKFTLGLGIKIAELPYATLTLPYVSNYALMFFIIGFMCLMFIRPIKIKINYILFSVMIFIGISIIVFTPKPIFYATKDHELVAFANNGKLEFNKSRASNHYFTFDTWKQLNGERTGTSNKRRKHDKGLYLYETGKFNLAYIQKFIPLQKHIVDLCNDDNIDYIVSYFYIDAPKCNHKILRDGFVIYKSGKVSYTTTNRPWHNPR